MSGRERRWLDHLLISIGFPVLQTALGRRPYVPLLQANIPAGQIYPFILQAVQEALRPPQEPVAPDPDVLQVLEQVSTLPAQIMKQYVQHGGRAPNFPLENPAVYARDPGAYDNLIQVYEGRSIRTR